MGFHHVAVACRDTQATHRFYTEAMGFELVKAVVAPTEHPGGWAKHLFYDTGGDGLIAFWELHDERVDTFDPAISTGLGLPIWTNHLAFSATLDTIGAARDRWLGAGFDVVEINHEFCVSIYTNDPNGILVEWCADARPLDADDRAHALSVVHDPAPTLSDPPVPVFHLAADVATAVSP
jgi:catechol 2,3-dioxygenase-like lactoylglutathione lyase family enzyme